MAFKRYGGFWQNKNGRGYSGRFRAADLEKLLEEVRQRGGEVWLQLFDNRNDKRTGINHFTKKPHNDPDFSIALGDDTPRQDRAAPKQDERFSAADYRRPGDDEGTPF